MIGGFPYIPTAELDPQPRGFNNGMDFAAGAMPADPEIRKTALAGVAGKLIAWDPVAQSEAWSVHFPGTGNGGTLTTAGNLVFQGTKGGEFAAYNATTGEKLWSMDVQSSVIAAPIMFAADGKQYVALLVGGGGVDYLAPGIVGAKGIRRANLSRILVFSLDGQAALPPAPALPALTLEPPASDASTETIADGAALYGRYCGVCHGDAAISVGVLPDLRASAVIADKDQFHDIVIGGARKTNGMAAFDSVLDSDGAEAVRAYVIARAHEDLRLQQQSEAPAQEPDGQ